MAGMVGCEGSGREKTLVNCIKCCRYKDGPLSTGFYNIKTTETSKTGFGGVLGTKA